MTRPIEEPHEPNEPLDERVSAPAPASVELDEDDPLRDWIKRSMAESALTSKMPDLLPGVQRRIRVRSRGKFFADGWSTTQARTSYTLIGVITLLLVALACVALSPWYGVH